MTKEAATYSHLARNPKLRDLPRQTNQLQRPQRDQSDINLNTEIVNILSHFRHEYGINWFHSNAHIQIRSRLAIYQRQESQNITD